MITPKFLQELISSPEYGDKNSETYKRATRYMNILYPGTVAFDATGRMMRPRYGYGTASMAKIHAMNVREIMGQFLKTKKIYQISPFIRIVAVGLKKQR